MTLITTLLSIIATSEVLRLVLTHKKSSRKQHFKQKLEGVEKMIWDLEFKRFKTREIRENIREEYDFMNSRVATLTDQIANWPNDKDEGDRKRLEDQKILAERDASRLLDQIKAMDQEIEGAKPSVESPHGIQGISEQIASLKELQTMLKDWIKTI